jgi:hypothetical protein
LILPLPGKGGQAAIRMLPAPPMQLVCRDSQIGRHRRDRLRAFLAEANCFADYRILSKDD